MSFVLLLVCCHSRLRNIDLQSLAKCFQSKAMDYYDIVSAKKCTTFPQSSAGTNVKKDERHLD